MGIFKGWTEIDDGELTEAPTSNHNTVKNKIDRITVRLTATFIKLINSVDDCAVAHGWNMTVTFPSDDCIDLDFASPNYSFSIRDFNLTDDCRDAVTIKKALADAVKEATSEYSLDDYVFHRELDQLQKEHKTIKTDDVQRYMQEGNAITVAIDGFIADLNGEAVAPQTAQVQKTKPATAKKVVPHHTDVIDAMNKAQHQTPPSASAKV
jgi:hypothetical protein